MEKGIFGNGALSRKESNDVRVSAVEDGEVLEIFMEAAPSNVNGHAEDYRIKRANRDADGVHGLDDTKSKNQEKRELPKVLVEYRHLSRESRRKLEDVLQTWSSWHAKHEMEKKTSSASKGQLDKALESGKVSFFPFPTSSQSPLDGAYDPFEYSDSPSLLACWESVPEFTSGGVAVGTSTPEGQSLGSFNKKFNTNNEVPLYDRTSLEVISGAAPLSTTPNAPGATLLVSDSRCFNCGSYNHGLKDCPSPRDAAAISQARDKHEQKKAAAGQGGGNGGGRGGNSRYHDASHAMFDGLSPGVLSPELRSALGLSDSSDPPWAQRMKELGPPPGYATEEGECEPSSPRLEIILEAPTVEPKPEEETSKRLKMGPQQLDAVAGKTHIIDRGRLIPLPPDPPPPIPLPPASSPPGHAPATRFDSEPTHKISSSSLMREPQQRSMSPIRQADNGWGVLASDARHLLHSTSQRSHSSMVEHNQDASAQNRSGNLSWVLNACRREEGAHVHASASQSSLHNSGHPNVHIQPHVWSWASKKRMESDRYSKGSLCSSKDSPNSVTNVANSTLRESLPDMDVSD